MAFRARLAECETTFGRDACWPWPGVVDSKGYGFSTTVLNGKRFQSRVYRMAYIILRGQPPEGTELDHLCRVRRCMNPWHTEPVTHTENVRRGRGGHHHSAKTHCPQGHPYDAENTITVISDHRYRACRICRREAWQRFRQRKRARSA